MTLTPRGFTTCQIYNGCGAAIRRPGAMNNYVILRREQIAYEKNLRFYLLDRSAKRRLHWFVCHVYGEL
jgi:hypothetical protein